jgi:hypothetical protein
MTPLISVDNIRGRAEGGKSFSRGGTFEASSGRSDLGPPTIQALHEYGADVSGAGCSRRFVGCPQFAFPIVRRFATSGFRIKVARMPGFTFFKKPQRFGLENMLARFRVMSSLPRFRFSAIHVVLFDPRYVLPLLLANLLFLWLSRGHYVAGWELLGVADGKRLVDGLGLLEGFHGAREAAREVTYWNATDSLFFGYLPGIAASYLPWFYWGHLYLFLAVVFFSWLFCRHSVSVLLFSSRSFWRARRF